MVPKINWMPGFAVPTRLGEIFVCVCLKDCFILAMLTLHVNVTITSWPWLSARGDSPLVHCHPIKDYIPHNPLLRLIFHDYSHCCREAWEK